MHDHDHPVSDLNLRALLALKPGPDAGEDDPAVEVQPQLLARPATIALHPEFTCVDANSESQS